MSGTRILHVASPAEVGGLERVLATLAAAQQLAGSDVHVALFTDGAAGAADRLLEPLRAASVALHVFPSRGRAYLRERQTVADLARTHHVDIIHTHGYRADVVAGSVARTMSSVAAVTTVHGFTGGTVRNRCYEWLQRRTFRRFDGVVAVSRPLAQHLMQSGVKADRVHMVRNAWQPTAPRLDRVAARQALGVPNGAFVLGWVGRLSHEKGADVMLEALSHLEDLPLSVQVLGDGHERQTLQALAGQRGLANKVVWRGIVPDAERLFCGFDVFVSSSRTEGTPMVLFEAMAAGVPIVATRVGGVPDMLGAEEALLVEPDSPLELGAAVRDTFENARCAADRAQAAQRRYARECRVSSWLEEYARVYQSAMGIARARQ